MNRINKILAVLALVGAAIVFGHRQDVALAQSSGSGIAVDTWTGRDDSVSTFRGSVGTTAAAVVTAVSGKIINVRAIQSMTLTSAGVLSFTDGSGGTVLGQYYLEANKPYQIDESLMGKGLTTTSGTGLFVVADVAATLILTHRIQKK